MPTVIDIEGFRVMIYLPPREHAPAHVHVFKGGGEVVIRIGTDEPLEPHTVAGRISGRDVYRALEIVAAAERELLIEWRKYHG